MKKYLFWLLFMALTCNIVVMGQTDERELYKNKIRSYSKTRNAGQYLLYSGIGVSVVGIASLVYYLSDVPVGFNGNPVYNEKYYMGVYGTGIGLDMVIGGIILNSIGSRKVRQYQEKLNNLSGGLRCSPHSAGLSLTYRF